MHVLVLLAAAAAAASAAPPAPAVLINRCVGVPRADAEALADQVASSLGHQHVEALRHKEAAARLRASGQPESPACDGSKRCAAGLGASLGTQLVVAIEVGALGKKMVIHLEAVRVSDAGSLVARDLIAASTRLDADEVRQIDEFARDLASRLAWEPVRSGPAPQTAPPASDLPREAKALEAPAPKPPEASLVVGQPSAPSDSGRTLAWTGTAVTAGVAAAAIGLAVAGASARGEFNGLAKDADGYYQRPQSEVTALAARENSLFIASAVCAGTAVLTGAITTWLWVRATSSPSP